MTKQEYCAKLKKLLKRLPAEERQETLRYYAEFLEEASDAERKALGTPEVLAARILAENGMAADVAKAEKSRKLVLRVALICTFYIWIPLLVTWYILLLCALICVAVIPIALAACLPICMVVVAAYCTRYLPLALLALGMGLVCMGIALLLWKPFWIACRSITRFSVISTRKMWRVVF